MFTLIQLIYKFSFAFGECTLALLFYVLQNWRHVAMVVVLLSSTMLVYPFLMPESIRWQLAHDQVEPAMLQVRKAASWNRVALMMPTDLELQSIQGLSEEEGVKTDKHNIFEVGVILPTLTTFNHQP